MRTPVTYENIRELLAPESVPDLIIQLAAVLELSNRKVLNRWDENLSGDLVVR